MRSFSMSVLLAAAVLVLAGALPRAAFAQDEAFVTGLEWDEAAYREVPRAAPLMRGDYDNLPRRVSLRAHAPVPQNQRHYPTCVGWATAYAARTILLARRRGWDDPAAITDSAFSASFVYNQISPTPRCKSGSAIEDALALLRETGAAKQARFEYSCDREWTAADLAHARSYRIKDYRRLFSTSDNSKVLPVKKSLSEGRPVVIGMNVPRSFGRAGREQQHVWRPLPTDDPSSREQNLGFHAMAVVGYDDEQYGGAFEVMNSWGTTWADSGFIWVPYDDLVRFTFGAYELEDEPPVVPGFADLAGRIRLVRDTGEEMAVRYNGRYFVTAQPYGQGTFYNILLSNNEPAYVYAFSSDTTRESFRLFPHDDTVSAYLGYWQNNVALPSEDLAFEIFTDASTGTEYTAVLYAKEPLDFDDLLRRMARARGTFPERLDRVLGDLRVDPANVMFEPSGGVAFTARSAGRTVVPVVVAIPRI